MNPWEAATSKDPTYSQLRPLLAAVSQSFHTTLDRIAAAAPQVPTAAMPLFDDIVDSVNITALRADQMLALFDAAAHNSTGSLEAAFHYTLDGAEVVARREAAYRVPVKRVADWRFSPTAYSFGYLWTVHSQFYWWRDYAKTRNAMAAPHDRQLRVTSPCYLNIEAPIDVINGDAKLQHIGTVIRDLFGHTKFLDAVADCLAPPTSEPVFPRDL